VARMRDLINQLPTINSALLSYLVDFLARVAARSEVNFMHIQNVATVFGPNLLRPKNQSALEMIGHTAVICNVVDLLIREYDNIFKDVKAFLDNESKETEDDKSEDKDKKNEDQIDQIIKKLTTEIQALEFQCNSLNSSIDNEITMRKELEKIVDQMC